MLVLNGNEYKTVLLDTNILREFVPDDCGQPKETFVNYLKRYLLNDTYVILITYNSFIEIFSYKDIFSRFIDYFTYIPFS